MPARPGMLVRPHPRRNHVETSRAPTRSRRTSVRIAYGPRCRSLPRARIRGRAYASPGRRRRTGRSSPADRRERALPLRARARRDGSGYARGSASLARRSSRGAYGREDDRRERRARPGSARLNGGLHAPHGDAPSRRKGLPRALGRRLVREVPPLDRTCGLARRGHSHDARASGRLARTRLVARFHARKALATERNRARRPLGVGAPLGRASHRPRGNGDASASGARVGRKRPPDRPRSEGKALCDLCGDAHDRHRPRGLRAALCD